MRVSGIRVGLAMVAGVCGAGGALVFTLMIGHNTFDSQGLAMLFVLVGVSIVCGLHALMPDMPQPVDATKPPEQSHVSGTIGQ